MGSKDFPLSLIFLFFLLILVFLFMDKMAIRGLGSEGLIEQEMGLRGRMS